MKEKAPVVTVDEEPVSSETTPERQINKGGEAATREVGKKQTPAETTKETQDKAGKGGCGCG